ncbi:hypothetical protein RDV64_18050 [Acuticoccus sp. MNP-M23]|uniref:hypothetical protein n=1 Tax=Acuticoccus sp. MNP-M23 TaxID=3072793 RepID=UPI002815B4F7|nr:hypothetical protein [Acuticoccus sp. MNP-M23]WMS41951.1 hypothetical protein RDV64_18050 [Acuticoccus sp. MNP-M23]
MSGGHADLLAAAGALLLPLLFALAQRGHRDRAAFLSNAGENGFGATFAGAVGGNIGIGSFLAIYLFAAEAPVIGFSLALAYSAGLVLCAVASPAIRARAQGLGSIGLADFIARAHGGGALPVWGALAVVFLLRSAVQLGALGLITADLFGGRTALAILAVTAILGTYLLVGGYRAAVGTDRVQAAILIAGMALAAWGLWSADVHPREMFTLGPYRPALLVGIWLLLPWSAVLGVDNWQRITLASTDRTAQRAYLGAAAVCAGILLTIAAAGWGSAPGRSVHETLALLMPGPLAWVATAVLVVSIMSSVDTFVMPLVSSIGHRTPLPWLRVLIAVLLIVSAGLAIAVSDLLPKVVAAFNSLVVFLPAAAGALFIAQPPRGAAAASMLTGLVAALAMTPVDVNSAALVGFAVAALVYGVVWVLKATRGTS